MNTGLGRLIALLTSAGILVAAPFASAQLAANPGSPIMYGADNMVADNTEHTVLLEGRVELLQEDSRLRADRIKIIYGQTPGTNKWDEVSRIEATGSIYYVTGDQTMKGDTAIYTKNDDTMVLSGDVVLMQGKNVMEGRRLTYNVGAARTVMDGAPANNGRSRVKGVFYPESSSAPAN